MAASMLLRAFAANGFRSMAAFSRATLEIGDRRARGGAQKSERRFRFDLERISVSRSICSFGSSTGLPQTWTFASAPKPNQLFFSRALTRNEISRRSPDGATSRAGSLTSTARCRRPGIAALELRFKQPVHFRERHVDRPPMRPRPLSAAARSRAWRGTDNSAWSRSAHTRFRLHADRQCHVRSSTRGCAANARIGRISSHKFGRPGPPPSEMERHILAHSRRGTFDRGIVAQAGLQGGDLVIHRRVEHRFDLVAEIDLEARDVGAGVAEIEPAGEVGLEPPCGRELGREVTATLPRKSRAGRAS